MAWSPQIFQTGRQNLVFPHGSIKESKTRLSAAHSSNYSSQVTYLYLANSLDGRKKRVIFMKLVNGYNHFLTLCHLTVGVYAH